MIEEIKRIKEENENQNTEPVQRYTEEEIKEAIDNLSIEEIDELLDEVIKEME